MKKETIAFITEKTNELLQAHSCSQEAKAAAEKWLNGAQGVQEAKAYMAALKELIMPVDMLIDFAGSEAGVKVFGEELAKQISAHAREIKAQGAVYCDCPACSAVKAILDKEQDIE